MVVDTSAIAAIFFKEPERQAFLRKLADADSVQISAATLLETSIVIERRLGDSGANELDWFLNRYEFTVVPVNALHVDTARRAWRTFGKGRHSASLNLGDCFSYALARISGEPLLAKGEDFEQTDLELCT